MCCSGAQGASVEVEGHGEEVQVVGLQIAEADSGQKKEKRNALEGYLVADGMSWKAGGQGSETDDGKLGSWHHRQGAAAAGLACLLPADLMLPRRPPPQSEF